MLVIAALHGVRTSVHLVPTGAPERGRSSPTRPAGRPAGWCGSLPRCPGRAMTWAPPASTGSSTLTAAGVSAVADTAHQGSGPAVRVPQRRRRVDPDTGRYRQLSQTRKEVNTAHARQRGPASGSTPS